MKKKKKIAMVISFKKIMNILIIKKNEVGFLLTSPANGHFSNSVTKNYLNQFSYFFKK
jgi:hypothetical protein